MSKTLTLFATLTLILSSVSDAKDANPLPFPLAPHNFECQVYEGDNHPEETQLVAAGVFTLKNGDGFTLVEAKGGDALLEVSRSFEHYDISTLVENKILHSSKIQITGHLEKFELITHLQSQPYTVHCQVRDDLKVQEFPFKRERCEKGQRLSTSAVCRKKYQL